VPVTNTSRRFGPHATAFGWPWISPPIYSYPVSDGFHAAPSHHLWYSARSVPSTNTSMRFGPQLTASGSLTISPPIFSYAPAGEGPQDRKSTRLNSSHGSISYAVFCLKEPQLTAAR